MSKTMLEVRNVSKSFGGLRAVDNVSLEINERDVIGLIGPNGSGKSTLFNLISGVLYPDSGEIYFEGIRIDNLPPYERFRLGICYSPQLPRLFKGMSVLENGLLPIKRQIGEKWLFAPIKKKWKSQEIGNTEKVLKNLESIQLIELYNNFASELSGGQMKLLQLGRTLLGEPKLLLLDEPGAGIAPMLAKDFFKRIIELREREGLTFFIIEHRLDLLFDIVDLVYVMDKGKIIAKGKPNEIIQNPKVKEAYLGG
ncbi:MAG: ABC transporter ATP-binding protein [Thermoprotei archaeon]